MTPEKLAAIAWENRNDRIPEQTIIRWLEEHGCSGGMINPTFRKYYLKVATAFCRIYREENAIAGTKCAVCEAELESHQKRYCSRECQKVQDSRLKRCRQCESVFQGRGGSTYCSRSCAQTARRQGEVQECEQCGVEYRVKPSEAKRRRFCSLDCAHENQRKAA